MSGPDETTQEAFAKEGDFLIGRPVATAEDQLGDGCGVAIGSEDQLRGRRIGITSAGDEGQKSPRIAGAGHCEGHSENAGIGNGRDRMRSIGNTHNWA